MLPTKLRGSASDNGLEVTENNGARVVEVPRPPGDWSRAEVEQKKVLVAAMENGGSADMTVDGSTTAADFSVDAEEGRIKWVTEVRLVHHDSQMNLANVEIRRFGSAAASPGLANGIQLIAYQGGSETVLFTVNNIGEYYTYAESVVGVTDGVAAGTDFLVTRFLLAVPVGLYPGSLDKVILRVRDNLTSLTLFEATATGWHEAL